jgi:hypothetical protein
LLQGRYRFEIAESKQRMKATVNGAPSPNAPKFTDNANKFARHEAVKESRRVHEQNVAEREAERQSQRDAWHRSPAVKTLSGHPLTPELIAAKQVADAARAANKPKQVQPLDAETETLLYDEFRKRAYLRGYRHSGFNQRNILEAFRYACKLGNAPTLENLSQIALELDRQGFLENPENRVGTSAARRWEPPTGNTVRPVKQTVNVIDGQTWTNLHSEDFDSLQRRVRAGFKPERSR